MSSKFDVIAGEGGNIALYLKELMSKPINSKDVYVNFTDVCKLYNKEPFDYLRLDSTKEYNQKVAKVRGVTIPIVKTIKGKYGGSYLHYVGLFNALRWVNIDFGIEMDYILEQVFRQADIIKTDRQGTITKFHPLTDAIKEYFVPNISNKMGKKMIYPTVMDFANKIIMGMTAKQFRALKAKEGVIVPKEETRCFFEEDKLDKIIAIEEKLYQLIVNLELENFHQLKAIYLKRVSVKKIWNYSKDELKALNAKLDIYEKRLQEYIAKGKQTTKIIKKIEELKIK